MQVVEIYSTAVAVDDDGTPADANFDSQKKKEKKKKRHEK